VSLPNDGTRSLERLLTDWPTCAAAVIAARPPRNSKIIFKGTVDRARDDWDS